MMLPVLSRSFLNPSPPPNARFVLSVLRRLQSTAVSSTPREDPNLIASRSAPHAYPPPSLKSQPRPKVSRGSQRASQPPRVKSYPDQVPRTRLPETVEKLPAEQCAPNLAYFVTRTPSNELPVYQFAKAGGNKAMTRIRRIDGNPEALRDELQQEFQFKAGDCVVNQLTKQVILRGHLKPAVEAFLKARRF